MIDYHVTDALAWLEQSDQQFHAIHLDDAWARPQRNGELGVEYPTHDMETTKRVVDLCWQRLHDGGWLIADADDYLMPRLVAYLQDEYGDVAKTYNGGGFRKVGCVLYQTKDDDPHRGMGEYLTNAGYHVVFAHKGATDRRSSTAKRQLAHKPTDTYGWGSVKPLAPYREWIGALLSEGESLGEPMAGTAPACIAAKQVFGDTVDCVAIDCEPQAKQAHERRVKQTATFMQETL